MPLNSKLLWSICLVGWFVPNLLLAAEPSDMTGKEAGEMRELAPGMKFHWCPPGKFRIGSPATELGDGGQRNSNEDQVEVTLTKGFWMGETEVTQGQWLKIHGTRPWKGRSLVKEGDDFPATYVCFQLFYDPKNTDNALEFCQRLTAQERKSGKLPKGWKFSLPTESQWEYACRAGTTTTYSFGDDALKLGDYAWANENASDIGEKYAHQVGLKKANPWGLKDMHGNLWEMCVDGYEPQHKGGTDPLQEGKEPKVRVYRGGCWNRDGVYCRSAFRAPLPILMQARNLGFRVIAVPEEGQ